MRADDDPGDVFPRPTRTEPRGPFPDHSPTPPGTRVLTAAQALDRAQANLTAWRARHPGRP
jgi:hypothetical protein